MATVLSGWQARQCSVSMAVCLHVCACCSESRKQKQKVYLIDGLMFIVPWISGDLYWGDIVIASPLFIYKVILIIISPFSLLSSYSIVPENPSFE
jgi:hypothetical protein